MDKDYKIAKAFALKILRRQELAEEVAQEVIIQRWKDQQNERVPRSIKFQVIDVIRRCYGSQRQGRPNRRNIEVLDRDGKESACVTDADYYSKDLWWSEIHNERDERMDFGFDIGLRTDSEKVVFDLYCNGFNQEDIAQMLRVTSSRICQIFRTIKKQTEKYYFLQKRLDEFKEDPQRFVLKIDWIQL